MLSSLVIKNYAIIDFLELEFENGLTALTGETGAGKSILLGALGLVLGDRADNDNIKDNKKYAEIVADFSIAHLKNALTWLKDKELDADNDCILRRKVSTDGRSRAFINNTPVTLQLIRELGELLIDIHGQHEHQSMMKPPIQRQLLDEYANNNELLGSIHLIHTEFTAVETELSELENITTDNNNRIDLLRFQFSELETLALEDGEYLDLDKQQLRLANSEKITQTIQASLQKLHLNEENNIQSELSKLTGELQQLIEHDGSLISVVDVLNDAMIQIEESISQLRNYDDVDTNQEALNTIEQRLEIIIDLSRKHRVEPENLTNVYKQISTELESFDHSDERLDYLRQQKEELHLKYNKAAKKLHATRADAAKVLNSAISKSMNNLGMKGGQFRITVNSNTDDILRDHGNDKVEYTVSTNEAQSLKPLSKVASGGELARISLAIQMIIAKKSQIPTMIFDEVDSGVGGGIAEVVGQHLRELGASNQVVCITHLPQVASQAHQHMRVHKNTGTQLVHTQVDELDSQQRVEEVARMLSGVEITQQSLEHAKDMISRAQNS